jgi:hypothetical protein
MARIAWLPFSAFVVFVFIEIMVASYAVQRYSLGMQFVVEFHQGPLMLSQILVIEHEPVILRHRRLTAESTN